MNSSPKRTPSLMSMADSPASCAMSDVSTLTERPRGGSAMSIIHHDTSYSEMSTSHRTVAASAMSTSHSTVGREAMNLVDDITPSSPLYFPIERTPGTVIWHPPAPISFEEGVNLTNDVLDSGVLCANYYFKSHDYQRSEQQWRIVLSQAFTLNRAAVYVDAITNIGQCIHKQGGVERWREFDDWWNLQRLPARYLGGWSVEVQVLGQFADLLHEQDRVEGEEQVRREIFMFLLNKLGQVHVATLDAQLNLGMVLCDLKKYNTAEKVLRSVFAHSVNVLGPGAWGTFQAKNALAECLSCKDMPAPREAEKLWGEILFDLFHAGKFNGEAWQNVQARLSEYIATQGSINAMDL